VCIRVRQAQPTGHYCLKCHVPARLPGQTAWHITLWCGGWCWLGCVFLYGMRHGKELMCSAAPWVCSKAQNPQCIDQKHGWHKHGQQCLVCLSGAFRCHASGTYAFRQRTACIDPAYKALHLVCLCPSCLCCWCFMLHKSAATGFHSCTFGRPASPNRGAAFALWRQGHPSFMT
jgi:hypothetical protein